MKKLLLGLGLLAATGMPVLADGVSPGWAPPYFTPPVYLKPPSPNASPLFQPLPPAQVRTLPGFPDVRASPFYTLTAPATPLARPGPMHVLIVRSSATDCGDHCAEWISAEGEIQDGTPALFRKALKAMGNRKLPVFISSPGGRVLASLAIGRMIRAKALDVMVSRTALTPCAADDKTCSEDEISGRTGAPASFMSYCASACADILAAGTRRIVPPHYSIVGVHDATSTRFWHEVEKIPVRNPFGQFTGYRTKVINSPSWQEPASMGQYKTFAAYFREMGIKGDIVSLMHLATPDQMHWLTAQELADTGLATERLSSEEFVAAINHPPGAPTVSAAPSPPTQPAAPLRPSWAHTVQTVDVPIAAPQAAASAPDPAPLPVHRVQTEATHVAADALPLLRAPGDDPAGPFANYPAGGVAPATEPATAKAAQTPTPVMQVATVAPVTAPVVTPAKPKANTPKSPAVATTSKHDQPVKKPAAACNAAIRTLPAAGRRLTGEVRVVMSPAAGTMVLQRVEETTHVQVNPKYFGYQRLGIWVYSDGIPEPGTAAAPHGMNVQPGDTVTIVTRHQDSALPCHFVPNLVVAVKHK